MDDGQGMDMPPDEGRDIGPDEIFIRHPQENGSQDRYRPVQMVRNVRQGNGTEDMDVEYETVYVENWNRSGDAEPEVIPETPPSSTVVPTVPLYCESKRLDTFKGKWLTSYHVTATDLARNGFYYLGPHDKVKCIFCLRTLRGWDPGDNVEEEHRRHYPNCPFVQGETVDQNIPMNYTEDLKKNMRINVKRVNELRLPGCKHEEFSGFNERLRTFDTWRFDKTVDRVRLAEVGFFYTGRRDTCKCHHCGKCIGKWEEGDDPLEEHLKLFPDCPYIQAMKVKLQSSGSQANGEEAQAGSAGSQQQQEEQPVVQSPSNPVPVLTNGHHHPAPLEPVIGQPVAPAQAAAPPATTSASVTQCTEPSQTVLDRDLQSAAVAAVLELEEMSIEQLTRVLQGLRLAKGPDVPISAADILNYEEQMGLE